MIKELILMNGYGPYVWSAFTFTMISFVSLYSITKFQLIKEQSKFISKFGSLNEEKAKIARVQKINEEILLNTSKI
jgi:heme exporter protein D